MSRNNSRERERERGFVISHKEMAEMGKEIESGGAVKRGKEAINELR